MIEVHTIPFVSIRVFFDAALQDYEIQRTWNDQEYNGQSSTCGGVTILELLYSGAAPKL